MSTTASLVNRIRVLAVQSGSRSKIEDADLISTALNPSARKVAADCLNYSKFETITLQVGLSIYSLPSTLAPFLRAASVTLGVNRWPLAWVLYENLAQITSSGQPSYWTIFDNKFIVRPTPSAADTIYIDAFGAAPPCAEITPASSTDELGFLLDAEDAVVFDAASVLCMITKKQNNYDQQAVAAMSRVKRRLTSGGESWPQQTNSVENLFIGGY